MTTTRRSLLLGLLLWGLIAAGLIAVDAAVAAVALPLVTYLGAVLLYHPARPDVTVRRELSDTYVGLDTEVTVTLTVTNNGDAVDEITIADTVAPGLTVTEGQTATVRPIAADETVTLTYSVTGPRGLYRFRGTRIDVAEHLGLFGRHTYIEHVDRLEIMPAVPSMRPIPIRPMSTHGFAGPIPSGRAGSGTDFYGVRSYAPGDPLRWINWRISARHPRKLFTNEYEQTRIADVGLILDARRRNNVVVGSESLFERGVEAAAALADMFLSDGHRVGLLIYGRGLERTFPGYGKHQRQRILRSLATARMGSSLVFDSLDYLPPRFFPAKSQIVLVSPLCEDDPPVLTRLRARGYDVLVVSPDPVTFEARRIPDTAIGHAAVRIARARRNLWAYQLKRVGIPVIDWQTDQPLDGAVRTGLRRSLHPIARQV